MSEVASRAQLRMSFFRWALVTVPLVVVLGFLSGQIAGSGEENRWFQALIKPSIQPPGAAFGIVWLALYAMIGIAVAMILHARGAHWRGLAIILFVVQLVLNLCWSPLFFGMHQVTTAFWLILLILAVALATTVVFARIRKAAAWLMVPYIGWLCFAALLNFQIDRLNPDAETLYVPAAATQI